jgi:hypothetical protein
MKKWLLLFVFVLLVGALCVDLFIPSTLMVARTVPVQCRAVAAFPLLSNENRWKDWWPGSELREKFRIRRLSYQSIDIVFHEGGQLIATQMSLLPVGSQDSSLLHWETTLHCGWSPVERLWEYGRARRLGELMDGMLVSASEYFSKKENLYGVPIDVGSTMDTLLIVTRMVKKGLPTNEDIYAQVDKLDQYMRAVNSRQTGAPMVNIVAKEDEPGAYRLMVALPVGTRIEGKGDISFMRLVPGRFLITEVKGGPADVDKALEGLRAYIRDYQLTVMAIPFQSLVTDRRQQDSTRWVTRIYYPIM